MVILRQAHDFDLLPTATYRESYSELVEQASKVEPAGEPGGNFYYTLAARNGQRFTEAVISSAAEGTLMSSEAGWGCANSTHPHEWRRNTPCLRFPGA